jgi:hypothetical protein
MIRSPEMLREVDERFDRERLAKMTYHEALEGYTAMWDHARVMGAVDLEPDIRIAHALNALSSED